MSTGAGIVFLTCVVHPPYCLTRTHTSSSGLNKLEHEANRVCQGEGCLCSGFRAHCSVSVTIGKCMSARLCGNLTSQLKVPTELSFFDVLIDTLAENHNFWRWSQFSRPVHKKQRGALVYKLRSALCKFCLYCHGLN